MRKKEMVANSRIKEQVKTEYAEQSTIGNGSIEQMHPISDIELVEIQHKNKID